MVLPYWQQQRDLRRLRNHRPGSVHRFLGAARHLRDKKIRMVHRKLLPPEAVEAKMSIASFTGNDCRRSPRQRLFQKNGNPTRGSKICHMWSCRLAVNVSFPVLLARLGLQMASGTWL